LVISLVLLLASAFSEIVQRMLNRANPLVDSLTNTIREYPVHRWKRVPRPEAERASQSQGNYTGLRSFVTRMDGVDLDAPHNLSTLESWTTLDESFDLGHRHFSSLHWLYPGTFLPTPDRSIGGDGDVYQSASTTLHKKAVAGGGHTG
jgi:hypothetical protein